MTDRSGPGKDVEAYRTIGEVAEDLHVPQHVLRFWETRFPEIAPLKRAGGRRFYRPEDVALLRAVQTLLYAEGYTIRGVQRLLGEFGARHVAESLARSTLARPASARDGSDGTPPAEAVDGASGPRGLPDRPAPAELSRQVAPGAAATVAVPRPDLAAALEGVLAELAECRRLLSTVIASPG